MGFRCHVATGWEAVTHMENLQQTHGLYLPSRLSRGVEGVTKA